MSTVQRKCTYQLYPSATQESELFALLMHHQQLYNWALKERKETYEKWNYGLTFKDQCQINTLYRRRRAEHGLPNANAQSEQNTLKRVDLAFQGFFRRVQRKQKPGYPRFKSLERYPGWGYNSHGDGWRLFLNKKSNGQFKHGKVRLSGVGMIKLRGQNRNNGGIPKTAEIIRKQGKWFLSVTFNYQEGEIHRASGTSANAFDWGVEHYVSMVDDKGNQKVVENPRFLKKAQEKITELQKDLALTKKRSPERKAVQKKLGNAYAKVARQRKDYAHKTSAKMIAASGLLVGEKLNVKSMTRSAKGTAEIPGKNVKQKAGLNREILNTAPASLYGMLKYKAEEAGISFIEAPTRTLKPSQRCPDCWKVNKKSLDMREHVCGCGSTMQRDIASATVVLKWALGLQPQKESLKGREPAWKPHPSYCIGWGSSCPEDWQRREMKTLRPAYTAENS